MYKALKSFSGKVTMKKGDTQDLKDESIIQDLLHAGYIEKVKEETKKIKDEIKEDVEKAVEKIEEKVEKPKKTTTTKKKK